MRPRKKKMALPFRKIIPNMITSGSILCGFFSLILVGNGYTVPAAWLILIAVVFDYLDGKVARSLGGSSDFGVELDSLADVISFGVAPAYLAHSVYIGYATGMWGATAAAFFALCGALRLARFNVMHVVGPFQGLPIPAAGLTLVSIVLAGIPLSSIMTIAVMLFLGGLMVSSVPYGNLKRLRKGNFNRVKGLFLLFLLFSMAIVLQDKAPFGIAVIYVTSGLLRFDWGTWLALSPINEEEDIAEEDI